MATSAFELYGPECSSEYRNYSLVDIIIDSLKKHGENEAFIDGDTGEVITHKQILAKSINVANALKHMDIKKNDIVAIISENHINYWIPVLACLYNGIIVHHLSPKYTKHELDHFYTLSKPKLIFCSNTTISQAMWSKEEYDFIKGIILIECNLNKSILCLDMISKTNSVTVDSYKAELVHGRDQVAFINNSSGTTGLPKGVMITCDNLRSILFYLSNVEYVNISTEATTICNLPFNRAFGQALAIGSIVLGMKTILMSTMKYDQYLSNIEKYKVTHLFVVPEIASFLAENEMVDRYNISSIKDILCGAGAHASDTQQLLRDRLKITVRQMYGMTEFTGLITMDPLLDNKGLMNGSIGVLIPGCIAKTRDIITNESLGPNESGELCFKGEFSCLGYLNNKLATSELFDRDGFICTGDMGYYDNEGKFYFLSRLKELIKYKSFQVAPADIENFLKLHKEIKDAAVLGIPDKLVGELPLAFVVRQTNSVITEQEIIAYVAAHLSVPKQLHGGVIFIDDIPKNPNGKILRRNLKDLYNNR